METLAIALTIEFLRRLPAIIDAYKDDVDITLDDIYPRTRLELEAEVKRNLAE